MKKNIARLLVLSAISVIAVAPAYAHVIVVPSSVGIGAEQTFTVNVPTEKEGISTVSIRLMLPPGLTEVFPTVHPGWTVTDIKNGTGENASTTALLWTGGRIPAGQRDEFTFSAVAPGTPTTLAWKAYQTYSDGSQTSWTVTPSSTMADDDSAPTGPYSTTQVIDDLTPAHTKPNLDGWALGVAILALLIALYAVLAKNPYK